MRKFLAAFAVAIAGGLMFASPAKATPTPEPEEEAPYCSTWQMRSIVQDWEDPAAGSVFTKNKATLVKPEGGGTEFATFNADIELASPQTLSVKYTLIGGAKPDAGAVRLFYYTNSGANTLTDTPTKFAAADANEGVLKIEDVEKIGTMGVVYDASNNAGGSAIFEAMTLGNMPIKFKPSACEVEPSPEPTPTPSTSPSASASPTPAATVGTGGVAGGDEPSLPVTGAPTKVAVGVAAALLVVGAALVVLGRRRNVRTETQ